MLFTLAISLKTKLVVIQKVYFLLSFTYETFNSFRISSTITFAVRTSVTGATVGTALTQTRRLFSSTTRKQNNN
jgi:hypothetical protein